MATTTEITTSSLSFSSLLNTDHIYNESPNSINNLYCLFCNKIPARRLPCDHIFCQSCSILSTPEHSLTLYCPICADQSIAPYDRDIDYLDDQIEYRLDQVGCQGDQGPGDRQGDHLDYQGDQGDYLGDQTVNYPLNDYIVPIDDHKVINNIPFSNLRISSYGSLNKMSHKKVDPSQTIKEAWTRLQTFSEACRRRMDQSDAQVRYPTDTLSDISELDELDESLNAIIELLENQEINDRTTRILKDLRIQENKLQNALSKINSHLEERERGTRPLAEAKVILRTLSMRAKLESQRLENETKNLYGIKSSPTIGTGILADPNQIQNGHQSNDIPSSSSSSSASPWTISVGGEGSIRCRRNVKNVATLQIKNGHGESMNLDSSQLSAYILAPSTGRRVTVAAIRETSTPGLYELTYYVNREGLYHLVLKFAGRHIGGSPFPIRCAGDDSGHYDFHVPASRCSVHSSGPLSGSRAASGSSGAGTYEKRTTTTLSSSHTRTRSKSPYRRIVLDDDMIAIGGTHGRAIGQFSNPQGICCTLDGRLVMADSNNQCVQIFDPQSGQCLSRFGKRGRSPGELQRPTGVCVLPSSGHILVSDYDNRWISVHDSDGKYLGRFGHGKLLGPRGISVDMDDHVIVVDNKASSILVYDLHKFKFVRQFGSRGDRVEQLAGPHYCAINPMSNLMYITDFHHHCVKVFDCRGQYEFAFGSLGEGNGQFQAPTGIAIDSNQHVLVADWGNSRIQVFDHSGSFLTYVNSNVHPLFGPQGLTMTADGHLAVVDTGNHCYKIYRYLS